MKTKDIRASVAENGLCYFDALTSPVRVSGLPFKETNGNWNRLDDRLTDRYPDGLKMLTECTSGAAVSFTTDSKRLAVRVDAIENHKGALPHMANNGSTGIDFYVGSGRGKKFAGVFHALTDANGHFEGTRQLYTEGMAEITLYLPLYAGIKKLEIGLDEDSSIGDPAPYTNGAVMFYGSSITQGACASRPGLAYCNILGRRFDFEVIDFGFSGCAKGEEVIAEEIASLDLSAFVYDYDHNADSAEYLEATHKRFFEIIREKHLDLPVIMVSKADRMYGLDETLRRRDVIKKTYEDAHRAGDCNVYFVDGTAIYKGLGDECTVDGAHPTDLGFYFMAEAIGSALEKVLK